ncbi:Nn.00g087800.m01.CDS01 [Neocucurbitaria sp. VM-36]
MEQENAPKSSGLENQLRDMILGNVTIAGGQANQDTQSSQHRPGRGRGRGRGRGGVSRGFDRNYPNRPDQGQGWHANAPANAASPRGGGRGHFSGQRYQQPQEGSQVLHGDGISQNPFSGDQSRHYVRRPPGSHLQQTPPTGPATSRTQPPHVLQRPQNNAIPPVQGQANPSTQHYPRPQNSYPLRNNTTQPRENPMTQVEHLDDLAAQEVPRVEMSLAELEEKETFRKHLEGILQRAFAEGYTGEIANISLVGFGSLASGFGMPGSDMDLAVVPEWKDTSKTDEVGIDRGIPRLLERAVLDAKMGGRLLTRTRVPILKICQSPTEALYDALFEERKKWDELPEEEKYPVDVPAEPSLPLKPPIAVTGHKPAADSPGLGEDFPELGTKMVTKTKPKTRTKVESSTLETTTTSVTNSDEINSNGTSNTTNKEHHPRTEKAWVREKVIGPLDFPKTGVGIQCDVNFENPLGIHNTHMLRCYSLTDPRVRPIVLFIKAWAKRRKINSSYSGTLSSYGWVLMVLHYLVNVAQPPVCPNLQHSIPRPTDLAALEKFFKEITISGYGVRFWRNEQEIVQAAQSGRLSQNRQTVGALLRGFFQYYSSISPGYNYGPRPPQFYWTTEVLSLRTPGGIQTKQSKGWVSATTKITAEKKVTNRYLFAIEDPFELDHNVARTVTHRGIVAIRDEFRRAWRILRAIGQGLQPEGGIFDEVIENVLPAPTPKQEETPAPQKAPEEGTSLDGTGQADEDGQQSVG